MYSKVNPPNIKALVKSILPDHLAAKYPRLLEFAELFFEYLDTQNRSSYFQNTLYYQRDVRLQEADFLRLIQKELGLLSNKTFAADPKLFYDHLSQLWLAKGSEESIKTFFRLFLDDEITVYYPWEAVLIPSDGRWRVDQVLRVSMISGNAVDFVGKTIRQVGRDGIAVVSKVEKSTYRDGVIYDLYLIGPSIVSKFVQQYEIYAIEDESLRAEIYKSVVDLNIVNKGSGYAVGDGVEISGYNGLTFKAYVSGVDENGGILKISIVNFGSGNTPLHILNSDTPPTLSYVDFYIYSDGELISVVDPEVVVFSDNGSGAVIEIVYGTIAQYAGYYEGVKGQLSEAIVLQDSNYYQKFSYEVTSRYSNDFWIEPLKKTVHPSGTQVFSNIKTFNEEFIGITNSFIFARTKDPVNYTLVDNPGITDTVLGLNQDYVYNNNTELAWGNDIYFAEDYVGESVFADTNTVESSSTNVLVDTIVTIDV